MKYHRLLVLIVIAGCGPNYTSGKTQCSDKKECPSGYSCSDDGTNAIHYCIDNKNLPACASSSAFYCSQSNTCWLAPGACSTVTYCGTTKNPGSMICVTPGYTPDCNGDMCTAPGVTGTGGSAGAGGGKDAGAGGSPGAGGTGGSKTSTVLGTGGSGGSKDAGVDAIVIGGVGGTAGKGGAGGSGGSSTTTTSLCSGVPSPCSANTSSSECLAEIGCAWNSTSSICTGTPSACTGYTSSTYCLVNGCSWSGTLVCTTSPVTSLCSSAQGTTTCSMCIASSCCAPLTNCVNDTNCSTNSTGPVWDTYLACAMNCCQSACSSTPTAAADNLLPGVESQGGLSTILSLPRTLAPSR